MLMRVLALINHEACPGGVFEDEVVDQGHELDRWVPSAGEIPRPLSEYGAVIAFGGGMQADEEELHPWMRSVFGILNDCLDRDLPTLGVCLGGQMLARAAGAAVGPAPEAECGWQPVELTDAGMRDPLFAGLPRRFDVFQWHSYSFELPPGAVELVSSDVCLQAFRLGSSAWGLQWHPEVTGETALRWARHHRPAPNGIPVTIDLPAMEATVAARIGESNDEGRALCARFLLSAQAQRE
jgi:GMP synthase-like glutamine amidotransferase